MPRYRILKGKIWVDGSICVKDDIITIKSKVAESLGLSCLELIVEPEPKKKIIFITQPERNLPKVEKKVVEEVVKVNKPRGRPRKVQ